MGVTVIAHTSSGLAIIPAILMAGVGIFVFVFWVRMLIECATKESSEGNMKLIWILVILLASWLGALIYYFVRRPQRIQEIGR
jgi:formate hydrogenlyase subunit 3/multisubunit Na+/H+ antiporter MnhD subunit